MPELTPTQRAYVRRKTRRAEPDPSEAGAELNIVPFLDIVVNLIMFLLMTATTVLAIGQVEAQLPQLGPCRGGCVDPGGLELSITVADAGIVVAGSGGVLAPGCESLGGGGPTIVGRDWPALGACLRSVKHLHPAERAVILTADPGVPYEDLVRAMDVARGDRSGALFPEIRLSAGVR